MRQAILILFLPIICSSCRAPVQDATVQIVSANDAVTITDVRFPCPSIHKALWYRVVVPKLRSSGRLPVLYLLHGINSSPAEIMERSAVVKLATAAHLIVVMPEADYSYYTNAKYKLNSQWEDAIAVALPHDVAARFPILNDAEHTGITGISMGGYGAAKLALKHPNQYGFVGTLSGALDITERRASLWRWGQTWRIWVIFGVRSGTRREEDVFELLRRTRQPQGVKWFTSCGQNDPLLAVNQRFEKRMRERGADIDSMITPDSHDWSSWNSALPVLFRTATQHLQ